MLFDARVQDEVDDATAHKIAQKPSSSPDRGYGQQLIEFHQFADELEDGVKKIVIASSMAGYSSVTMIGILAKKVHKVEGGSKWATMCFGGKETTNYEFEHEVIKTIPFPGRVSCIMEMKDHKLCVGAGNQVHVVGVHRDNDMKRAVLPGHLGKVRALAKVVKTKQVTVKKETKFIEEEFIASAGEDLYIRIWRCPEYGNSLRNIRKIKKRREHELKVK